MKIDSLLPLYQPSQTSSAERPDTDVSFHDILQQPQPQETATLPPTPKLLSASDLELYPARNYFSGTPEQAAEALANAIDHQVRQRASARSIDLSTPVRLYGTADGKVRVDHPQGAEIEEIFASDPELTQMFTALSATHSLMRAAQQAEQARSQWTGDPEIDSAILARIQSIQSQTFSLVIGDDGNNIVFE